MVAEKMKIIAKNHQIICITHLPQIAAMADDHYLIEKKNEENSTKTEINKLNYDESVMELSRMLGGAVISEVVVGNAREMKKWLNKKNNTAFFKDYTDNITIHKDTALYPYFVGR